MAAAAGGRTHVDHALLHRALAAARAAGQGEGRGQGEALPLPLPPSAVGHLFAQAYTGLTDEGLYGCTGSRNRAAVARSVIDGGMEEAPLAHLALSGGVVLWRSNPLRPRTTTRVDVPSAACLAALNGHSDALRELLGRGNAADLSPVPSVTESLLHCAVLGGDGVCVQLALAHRKGPPPTIASFSLAAHPTYYCSPLSLAVSAHSAEMVAQLLAGGEELDGWPSLSLPTSLPPSRGLAQLLPLLLCDKGGSEGDRYLFSPKPRYGRPSPNPPAQIHTFTRNALSVLRTAAADGTHRREPEEVLALLVRSALRDESARQTVPTALGFYLAEAVEAGRSAAISAALALLVHISDSDALSRDSVATACSAGVAAAARSIRYAAFRTGGMRESLVTEQLDRVVATALTGVPVEEVMMWTCGDARNVAAAAMERVGDVFESPWVGIRAPTSTNDRVMARAASILAHASAGLQCTVAAASSGGGVGGCYDLAPSTLPAASPLIARLWSRERAWRARSPLVRAWVHAA
jgi:hypothetical protein